MIISSHQRYIIHFFKYVLLSLVLMLICSYVHHLQLKQVLRSFVCLLLIPKGKSSITCFGMKLKFLY